MTEPAPQPSNVHTLPTGTVPAESIDPTTGEVLAFTGPTVPVDKFRQIEAERDGALAERDEAREMAETLLSSLVAAEKRAQARERALCRELADERKTAADAEEITEFLTRFCTRVGRKPEGGNVALTSYNATCYRWMRRTWSRREIGLMVVGLLADDFHVSKGFVDLKYVCSSKRAGKRVWDEGKCERWLRAGELVRGERAGVTE